MPRETQVLKQRRRRVHGGLRINGASAVRVDHRRWSDGCSIAQVFAAAGHSVTVFEPSDAVRASILPRIAADLRLCGQDESLADRIVATDGLTEAVAGAVYVTEEHRKSSS